MSENISWMENSFTKRSSTSASQGRKRRTNIQEYFTGPRDITRHSKWPRALRMHGSVTPKIVVRTLCVAIWSAVITVIHEKVHPINVHPIITTVLGILVGFSLNLRSSTAYERYMEGRKVWSKLTGVSTSLARSIWIFTAERKGAIGKDDLLGKVSFMNLIVALALSLKYKLRFKPYIQYDDLHDLVSHLDTFARDAGEPTVEKERGAMLQHIQNLLRLAEVNPRRELKRAKRPLGNLPIEILSYMSAYISSIVSNETLRPPNVIPSVLNALQEMNDILVTADRILNTPLPIAYTIAISQITWIYIITFTIQLVTLMGWLTIPTTVVASYIILGFAAIGNEIENPFGVEVNDLPLEQYCAQIASDIAIISSRPPPKLSEYALHPDNKPLYPISSAGSAYWPDASIEDIRDALKTRAMISKPTMWRRQSMPPARGMSGGQSLRGHRDDSHDSTVVGEAHEMKNDRKNDEEAGGPSGYGGYSADAGDGTGGAGG